MTTSHRVRFAPSPSGNMHIGNIRAAILNILCAKESKGTFILRIEDTDIQRTKQSFLENIYQDLAWLNIIPDEGPQQGGNHAPYIQSQRLEIYKKYLEKLIEKGHAYRCFATKETLERMREVQIAQKLPPRYDRAACSVSKEKEAEFLEQKTPYIWRFQLPTGHTTIHDKARGDITYQLHNFADCPLTREDGTFTFLFANFVDDVEMNISYIIRGEDHMSNTAIQAAMYDVFSVEKPLFYHLPIICNKQGQKLSKRDFGFSLQDLIEKNYLPEAVLNYLILLGNSFEPEVFSLEEAAEKKLFEKIHSTGNVQYSIEKLDWINAKWIQRLSLQDFLNRLLPLLEKKYGKVEPFSSDLLSILQKESRSLSHAVELIEPFVIENIPYINPIHNEIIKHIAQEFNPEKGYDHLAEMVKKYSSERVPAKEIWKDIRIILTGSTQGINLKDIIKFLSHEMCIKRFNHYKA